MKDANLLLFNSLNKKRFLFSCSIRFLFDSRACRISIGNAVGTQRGKSREQGSDGREQRAGGKRQRVVVLKGRNVVAPRWGANCYWGLHFRGFTEYRSPPAILCRPLGARIIFGGCLPRALPRAVMFRPFRPE